MVLSIMILTEIEGTAETMFFLEVSFKSLEFHF
ncbi:hypothetical protein MNBD_GAMMA12-772 [hydrothermal vent metagenome]|uniref:Uncharacterized protein n=1 Tax=hydrothermal vent metagenome TaxID=652676 RepID=A0A3B0YE97_9ZZZZ